MSKIWIPLIAILEMVGGVFGIAFVIWQLVATQATAESLTFALIVSAIYTFSFIAGLALWLRRPFGRTASLIVQGIQLPKYFSQFLNFMFSFGFDAYVYGTLSGDDSVFFGVKCNFLAYSQFLINVHNGPVGFGFSISACVFLLILLKFKPQPVPPPPDNTGAAPSHVQGGEIS
jgi:hypothetical protein